MTEPIPLSRRAAFIASPSGGQQPRRAVIFHSGAQSRPWTLYLPYNWPKVASHNGPTSTATYSSHARAVQALEGVLAVIAWQQKQRPPVPCGTSWERIRAQMITELEAQETA